MKFQCTLWYREKAGDVKDYLLFFFFFMTNIRRSVKMVIILLCFPLVFQTVRRTEGDQFGTKRNSMVLRHNRLWKERYKRSLNFVSLSLCLCMKKNKFNLSRVFLHATLYTLRSWHTTVLCRLIRRILAFSLFEKRKIIRAQWFLRRGKIENLFK